MKPIRTVEELREAWNDYSYIRINTGSFIGRTEAQRREANGWEKSNTFFYRKRKTELTPEEQLEISTRSWWTQPWAF
jgi:hypothetical protein